LEAIGEENSLAIAIVGEGSHQMMAINNNSICACLNPGDKFSSACERFCGKALEKAREVGKPVGFVCHAGLDCRAFVPDSNNKQIVIIGRTFLRADNYRKATERAVAGDWRQYPPSELFENVLLTSSADVLNKTMQEVRDVFQLPPKRRAPAARSVGGNQTASPGETNTQKVADVPAPAASDHVELFKQKPETQAANERESKKTSLPSAEVRAWRSFFGSILKKDYSQASTSMLEFLAHQFGLTALVWLEEQDGRFKSTASFGSMKGRKVRLGVSPDDHRLIKGFSRGAATGNGRKVGQTGLGRFP
jgi:ligand-binding sensor protein